MSSGKRSNRQAERESAARAERKRANAGGASSFWTGRRAAAAVAGLALAAVIAFALFGGTAERTSTDDEAANRLAHAVASESKPASGKTSGSATVTVGKPSSPSQPAPPAAFPWQPPESVMKADVQMLEGKPVRLSSYGGKVVVLNLWATWCGPCRMEIPLLIELEKEYERRGVKFLGLSIEDPAQTEGAVREYARNMKITYPLGWASRTFSMELMRDRTNIPQTYIFGKDGRVLQRFVGFNPETSGKKLRDAIDQALK